MARYVNTDSSVNSSSPKSGFFAYPANPPIIGQTIMATLAKLERVRPSMQVASWQAVDIVGKCLIEPIVDRIASSNFLLADITQLNLNVVYEIGFAIGKGRRVYLFKNRAFTANDAQIREVGIFDTVGYHSYSNSEDLLDFIRKIDDYTGFPVDVSAINRSAPIYIVVPEEKTEAEIRLISRIKKVARIFFRSYDPQEHGRMAIRDAMDGVSSSLGVVLPLISNNRRDALPHNVRCFFAAGLAHALEKETLILQAGEEPVPLDLRDAVSVFHKPSSIDPYIAEFAPRITELLQRSEQAHFTALQNPLQQLFIGESAAENEFLSLGGYYLQTDEFRRVLQGNVQVVAGRKGSGKTALFFQVRDRVRRDKKNVILDLNPEGFQLRKLNTLVLDHLEDGTREHTITAFWEYLLLLELCNKLLESDRVRHTRDHTIREEYQRLSRSYQGDRFVSEGDFAERLLRLTEDIEERFVTTIGDVNNALLTRGKLTEILYRHDINRLRSSVADYMRNRSEVWILFDNIDKGWTASGLSPSDLVNLRCLLEALAKLKRDFTRQDVPFCAVVFVRNDVYELLVQSMSDRGKLSKVVLDWTDPDLLRELLRRRFTTQLGSRDATFDNLWRQVAVTHTATGEETSTYILDRCLMRPRALLDFLQHCRSHAVNVGHTRIQIDDIEKGEKNYSTDLISQIDLEIHDVFASASPVLYAFIESTPTMRSEEIMARICKISNDRSDHDKILSLLIWYGFLGVINRSNDEVFIYNVNYENTKMMALIANRPKEDLVYSINKAFWSGLEIRG